MSETTTFESLDAAFDRIGELRMHKAALRDELGRMSVEEVRSPEYYAKRRELQMQADRAKVDIERAHAWVDARRREIRSTSEGTRAIADAKIKQAEMALEAERLRVERQRIKSQAHCEERERKIDLLAATLREVAALLADGNSAGAMATIRERVPWVVGESAKEAAE